MFVKSFDLNKSGLNSEESISALDKMNSIRTHRKIKHFTSSIRLIPPLTLFMTNGC